MSPLDSPLMLIPATWYLTYVLTTKKGPWNLFLAFRTLLPLGGLTHCMPCFSIWIAVILLLLWSGPLQFCVVCLGVAGAALMLGSYSGATHV